MAGIPFIIFGRTNNLTWGITNAITDTSDLYKEKIEGENYFVDGQWKPLKKVVHNIKVKGYNITHNFNLFYTHRGPVMSSSMLKNAQVRFGENIPVHDSFGDFSMSWTGHYPGESMLEFIRHSWSSKSLIEL